MRSGAKVCKSCRSRQELSNGYLLLFDWKFWCRYSREQASQSLPTISHLLQLENKIKSKDSLPGSLPELVQTEPVPQSRGLPPGGPC